jgi:hypothetical protein
LAIRRRRIWRRLCRRWRALPAAKRAFYHGIVKNLQRSESELCKSANVHDPHFFISNPMHEI